MNRAFLIPLERSILEFRGVDVLRFLNGQLSNDVRKLQPDRAMHACVMTAKGRMNAEVWLTRMPDFIRLDGPPGIGEELLARFERYIISDDVTITDVTGSIFLQHTTGLLDGENGPEGTTVASRRFNQDGFDSWLALGMHRRGYGNIENLTPLQAESFRIENGVPAWGAELNEDTIPVEAGLDRDCIDYHKGCYIGQEVISRIKSVGHVNRSLVRLRTPLSSALAKGASLYAEGQPVGKVTSCAPSLDLENIVALAYVKRAFSAPGTIVTGQPDGREPHVVLTLHP